MENAELKNQKSLNYEMFGAVGDGVFDDTEAIRACHTYANENRIPVILNTGKSYYIPPMDSAIEIKTDVDFGDALFIIDDRNLTWEDERRRNSVFHIRSYYDTISLTADSEEIKRINENGGLKCDTKKIDLGLGYPALLKIQNSNSKRFIRYGANQNSGGNQTEVVLIDSEGNIDKDTPIVFDFDTVTNILVIRADEAPMTVRGGVFNLRANHDKSSYKYFSRNIDIKRSNLTVSGLRYKITDELPGKYDGQPYISFLITENSNNVKFVGCFVDGHRTYYAVGSGGSEVGMGSKALNATCSNNVVYDNCIQTNMFTDETETVTNSEIWGIMSSNYSKNISFLNSTLSRFDAHCGIYNGTVKNCRMCGIRIVGAGDFVVEDCEFFAPNKANTFISTREDFGSFWKGRYLIKNVFMHTMGDWPLSFITGHWYNHNFGYETCLPEEIIIDNFKTDNQERPVLLIGNAFRSELLLSMQKEIDGAENKNPTKPPKRIVIKNSKGTPFVLPNFDGNPFFADTEIVIEDGE